MKTSRISDEQVLEKIQNLRKTKSSSAFKEVKEVFKEMLDSKYRASLRFAKDEHEKELLKKFIEQEFYAILVYPNLELENFSRTFAYIDKVLKARVGLNTFKEYIGEDENQDNGELDEQIDERSPEQIFENKEMKDFLIKEIRKEFPSKIVEKVLLVAKMWYFQHDKLTMPQIAEETGINLRLVRHYIDLLKKVIIEKTREFRATSIIEHILKESRISS